MAGSIEMNVSLSNINNEHQDDEIIDDSYCSTDKESLLEGSKGSVRVFSRITLFLKNPGKITKILLTALVALIFILIGLILILHRPQEKLSLSDVVVKFHELDVKFGELFANDSEVYNLITKREKENALRGDSKELSKAIASRLSPHILLIWPNMTENLQKYFWTRNVNFQGKIFKFQEILGNIENFYEKNYNFNDLSPKIIRETLNATPLKISSPSKEKVPFYIERFFIDEKIISNLNDKEGLGKFYVNGRANKSHPDVKNCDEILKEIESERIFILKGRAGQGKTTTLEHMTKIFNEKFPSKWIEFLDLKMLHSPNDLSNSYNIKSSTEKTFFTHLISSNNTIFIWDGIDEVSHRQAKHAVESIKKIMNDSNNIHLISTRYHNEELDQDLFNRRAFKLLPLGKSEEHELYVKLTAINKIKFNLDSAYETMKDFHQKILYGFEENANYLNNSVDALEENLQSFKQLLDAYKNGPKLEIISLKNETISNPLLISMLANMENIPNFEANKTFNDSSGMEENRTKKSLTEFFHIYVDQKLTLLKNRTLDEVLSNHEFYAAKLYVDPTRNLIYNTTLSNEEFSQIGFLEFSQQNLNEFEFKHQSFAEFFGAYYLVSSFDNYANSCYSFPDFNFIFLQVINQAFQEDFLDINSSFTIFFNFWFDKIEMFKEFEKFFSDRKNFCPLIDVFVSNFYEDFKKSGMRSLPPLKSEFDEKFKDIFYNNTDRFRKILGDKLFKFILMYTSELTGSGIFSEYYDKHAMDYLEIITNEKNITETDWHKILIAHRYSNFSIKKLFLKGPNLLTIMAYNLKMENLTTFWEFTKNQVNRKIRDNILMAEDESTGYTALHAAAFNRDPKSFQFVKSLYDDFTNDGIKDILLKSKNDKLFLLDSDKVSGINTTLEVAKFIWEIFKNDTEKLRIFLFQGDTICNLRLHYSHEMNDASDVINDMILKTRSEEEKMKNFQLRDIFFGRQVETSNFCQSWANEYQGGHPRGLPPGDNDYY